MKSFIILITFLSLPAFAGRESGGGDPCEDKIQEIRDELTKWIKGGGPKNGLELPDGIGVQDYSKKMLTQMSEKETFVKCVKNGDPGYPVVVEGEPKVCKFNRGSLWTKSQIICDYDTFLNKTNDFEQYKLIHHEFAGAAGIEIPNGPVSEYKVTNQLNLYLEVVSVVKLRIKPNIPNTSSLKDLYISSKGEFSLDQLPVRPRPGSDGVKVYPLMNNEFNTCYAEAWLWWANDGESWKFGKSPLRPLYSIRYENSGPVIEKATATIHPYGDIMYRQDESLEYVLSISSIENFKDKEGGLNSWRKPFGHSVGTQTVYKRNGPYLTFYGWFAENVNAPEGKRQQEYYGYCFKKND